MNPIPFPSGYCPVFLSPLEIELLATAIERDAIAHDKKPGSCPADLHDAMIRAAELRKQADEH